MKTIINTKNANKVSVTQQSEAFVAVLAFLEKKESITANEVSEIEVHWSSMEHGYEIDPDSNNEVIEVVINTNNGYYWCWVNRNNEVVEYNLEDCYE